jgi:uncharacterized membrane protein YbhN (UPF0104 family)
MKSFWQRWSPFLSPLFALFVVTISFLVIRKELREYGLQEIIANWQAIPHQRKLAAIALTSLGYLVMTGYDFLGFHYIKETLKPFKIAFTAFVSYAIGNTVGFTVFSGTMIRYRFYQPWGVPPLKIARLIVFTHMAFWLGIFAVGGSIFIFEHLTFPEVLKKMPFTTVRPLGVIFLIIVALYFSLSFFQKKPLVINSESIIIPKPGLSLALITVSAVDWLIASGVLYLLLPRDFPLSYISFFGVYLIAMVAGLISSVPGGLGVFETVILLLRPDSVPAPAILGSLLAYRGVYYFLPFIVALILFILQSFMKKQ